MWVSHDRFIHDERSCSDVQLLHLLSPTLALIASSQNSPSDPPITYPTYHNTVGLVEYTDTALWDSNQQTWLQRNSSSEWHEATDVPDVPVTRSPPLTITSAISWLLGGIGRVLVGRILFPCRSFFLQCRIIRYRCLRVSFCINLAGSCSKPGLTGSTTRCLWMPISTGQGSLGYAR